MKLTDLRTKMFADGADKSGMLEMYRNPEIKGFTTNPTLMRKAGIADYEAFAHDILRAIPIARSRSKCSRTNSMRWSDRRARSPRWGDNVYVKIPVTNTRRESCRDDLVRTLVSTPV